ncbi:hypothetical protein [Blastococcus montanus]|uniref:hypothetical protein n=1 Tax=Blastococcus montanus TaxID=3144973 RepID=UPI003208F7D4
MPRTTRARPSRRRARRAALTALAGPALLLPACATETSPAAAQTGGHGDVAGAEELAEPQLRLSYLDTSGQVHALDLLTGETIAVGSVGPAAAVAGDGRFLFVASDPAGELTVVDTGTWTVDHGDHAHYYRAQPRVVGALDWDGAVRVASSERVTTLFSADTGAGVVLDRAALGQGRIDRLATTEVTPHDGVLLPLGDSLIATGPDRVAVLDAAGEPVDGVEAPCEDVRGGAATLVGVVVSCADGAVLATEADGAVAFERIPYPEPVAAGDRATAFAQRPGRPVLAAVAGERGVWLLDTRARSWQLVGTPTPLVRAVAADDERDRVLGLDVTGRLVVIEPATGGTATTDVLVAAPDEPAAVTLEVDADRAYVNVPSAGVVHEVDYADGARIARTFDTAVPPAFLAETGR